MKWAMFVLVVAGCGAITKPHDPDRRLRIEATGDLFESDRGYQFAVLPDAEARVVRLDVVYPVGSIDDPPGKEGLAHLVEHMLFDVEIERGGQKTSISAELGRLALSWNAETRADETDYQVVVAPEHLADVIGLEVDRMTVGCGGLSPAIVAREREVVLNELRQNQGASGAQVQALISNAVFPEGHPYRRVDSVETVEKLDFKDVCDFLTTRYHAGEVRVIASGQVSVKSLQEAAQQHFGRLHPRHEATRPVPAPVQLSHSVQHVKADVDEPLLVATWALPPKTSREYRLLDLITDRIAPTWEEFAFLYGWGHSPQSWELGGRAAPVLAVAISLSSLDKADEAMDEAEKSAADAISSLGHEQDGAAWVGTWENQAEYLLARWEGLGTRNALMNELLEDPRRTLLAGRVQELHDASPGEVRTLAEKWLATSRAHYVLIEPTSTDYHPHKTYAGGGAEAHATDVDGTLADRPLPSPPASASLGIEHYTLDNGLSVVMWNKAPLPLVHGALVVHAGAAQDPAGAEGVAHLVGASDVNADDLVFSGRSLAIRVDDLVRSLGWELRGPGYGLSDETKNYLKARLRAKSTADRVSYERDLLAAIYGEGHPYARVSMTAESVDKLHRDLVMDWARDHIVPANSVLILAGQFDDALIKEHVAYNVAHVSSGKRTVPAGPATERDAPAFIAGTETRPSPTLELDVAFQSGPGLGHNYAKRLVLQQILESRFSDLRAKQAVTYGVEVEYDPRIGGGMWRITGEVDASRADEAAKGVIQILDQLRRDPESYRAAFVLARQKVLEQLLVGGSGSLGIVERLEQAARFDLPDDFYDKVAQQVAALTLKDMPGFIAHELDANHQVFGAYGNSDAVMSALRAARSPQ